MTPSPETFYKWLNGKMMIDDEITRKSGDAISTSISFTSPSGFINKADDGVDRVSYNTVHIKIEGD